MKRNREDEKSGVDHDAANGTSEEREQDPEDLVEASSRKRARTEKVKSTLVVFKLPRVKPGDYRIIVAGLDPPAGSVEDKQHDNSTSKTLIIRIGHNRFDWIDFSKRCNVDDSLNAGFDRNKYYKELMADPNQVSRFRLELEARVREHLEVGNPLPVVYAAGVVVNKVIATFSSWTLTKCSHGISIVTSPDLPGPFLLMTGYDHPTAAVQSGGKKSMRTRHDDLVNMLITMSDPAVSSLSPTVTAVNAHIASKLDKTTKKRDETRTKIAGMLRTKPKLLPRLSNLPLHDATIVDRVASLIQLVGVPIAKRLVQVVYGFVSFLGGSPDCVERIAKFGNVVGVRTTVHWRRLLTAGVITALHNRPVDFFEGLAKFSKKTGI